MLAGGVAAGSAKGANGVCNNHLFVFAVTVVGGKLFEKTVVDNVRQHTRCRKHRPAESLCFKDSIRISACFLCRTVISHPLEQRLVVWGEP